MYKQIHACRICGNSELPVVLDLGIQRLTGVFPKCRDQLVTAGPLALVKCSGNRDVCGLLQLQDTYDLAQLYGDNYGYRSGLNASMVSHLQSKVRDILKRVTLPEDALIIDIGSNDSTTLQAYPKGHTLVGVDPTGAKFRSYYPPHIELIADFFSAALIKRRFPNRRASVITSISMFYDLEQPLQFMREVSELLADDGIWVLEQSYMPTMLARTAYDTVCHEHLEYYSLAQIKWMADRSNLEVIDVEFNDVNGGSFSVVVARRGSHHSPSSQVAEAFLAEKQLRLNELQPYQDFAARTVLSRRYLRSFLDNALSEGKTVAALGASTKGNVLLQYCNVSPQEIMGVGEVNEDKFGSFTPGTLIPILSEADLLAKNPDYLLVLPWHFREFFLTRSKLKGRQLVFPLPQLEVVTC